MDMTLPSTWPPIRILRQTYKLSPPRSPEGTTGMVYSEEPPMFGRPRKNICTSPTCYQTGVVWLHSTRQFLFRAWLRKIMEASAVCTVDHLNTIDQSKKKEVGTKVDLHHPPVIDLDLRPVFLSRPSAARSILYLPRLLLHMGTISRQITRVSRPPALVRCRPELLVCIRQHGPSKDITSSPRCKGELNEISF